MGKFYGFVLLMIAAELSTVVSGETQKLVVGEPLNQERVPFETGIRLYALVGLQPFSSYEVKVSYPASNPCSFWLVFEGVNTNPGARKLLDTEKLSFSTNENAIPLAYKSSDKNTAIIVAVHIVPNGVRIDSLPQAGGAIFNIECDELNLGAIPSKSWPLIGFIIFGVISIVIVVNSITSNLSSVKTPVD